MVNPVRGANSLPFADGIPNLDVVLFLDGTTTIVPADKRLVIEFVSVDVTVPSGQKVIVSIGITFANGRGGHPIVMTPLLGMGASDVYRASQLVKLYADPGSEVSVFVQRRPAAGNGHIVASFFGYYENMETAS